MRGNLLEILKAAVLFGTLFICSIKDVRKREISVQLVIVGILYGVFYQMMQETGSFYSVMMRCLLGIVLMALAVLTEGKIGFGDGLVVFMGGLYFQLYEMIQWIFFAFILCTCFGVGMIFLKKASRKTELAFVPFLFVSAVLQYVI